MVLWQWIAHGLQVWAGICCAVRPDTLHSSLSWKKPEEEKFFRLLLASIWTASHRHNATKLSSDSDTCDLSRKRRATKCKASSFRSRESSRKHCHLSIIHTSDRNCNSTCDKSFLEVTWTESHLDRAAEKHRIAKDGSMLVRRKAKA